jgi:hypothetical protein
MADGSLQNGHTNHRNRYCSFSSLPPRKYYERINPIKGGDSKLSFWRLPSKYCIGGGPMGCFSKDVKNKTGRSNSQRTAVFRTSLYLLIIAPLVAGCASNQLGPTRPISIDYDVALVWPLAYPQDLTAFNSASGRNQILTARMYIADMEYHAYEARLTREMQDEGILATAVSLGLTTSATLVPLAQTKTLLSGIATGVTGLDKAYDEKELLSNTIQALQTQMRADRKTLAAEIYAKMFKDAGHNTKTITPIAEYTLPMALSDADAYYQAGTVASSLIGLSKTVANAETNADQAKAAKGPNPAAVLDASTSAAPLSPNQTARQAIQHQIIGSAIAPIPAPFVRPRVISTPEDPRFGPFEPGLLERDIRTYQKLVCVKQDGKLGDRGSSTRQAIHKYLLELGAKTETDIIRDQDAVVLRRAIRDGKSACAP